jgi:CAAX protease family protein
MSSPPTGDGAPDAPIEPALPEPRPWGLWSSLAWYVLIYEIAARAYNWFVTASGWEQAETHSTALNLLDIVLSWAKTFLLMAFAVWLTGIPLRRYLGWVRPRAGDIVLGIVAVLAVINIPPLLRGDITGAVADYRAAIAAGTSPWWYVFQSWPAMVFAPVVEECFFRGFLWRGVQFSIGNWGALLVTSALFVLIHDIYWYHDDSIDWFLLASYFADGLTLGWLRWRSGGTTVPMIAHTVVNTSLDAMTVAISAALPQ